MIFSPKNKAIQDMNIKIGSECLSRVKETKFLGVILDQRLSWSPHILNIKSKVAKTIGILHKARQTLGRRYLISLYNTLILPYFTYCKIIWGGSNDTTLRPILQLQKKAVRCICNLSKYSSTSSYFKQIGILKLKELHKYANLIFMYNFKKRSLPNIFDDYFKYNHEIHRYATRQSHNFHVPKYKSNLSKCFIRYNGAITWNEYENKIPSNVSISTFKKNIKRLFIQNY